MHITEIKTNLKNKGRLSDSFQGTNFIFCAGVFKCLSALQPLQFKSSKIRAFKSPSTAKLMDMFSFNAIGPIRQITGGGGILNLLLLHV
jgi:hypothetical protein